MTPAWQAIRTAVPRAPRAAPLAATALAATALAATALAATALAAGCSAGPPAASRGSVAACYSFAAQALARRTTVTTVPPACRGLSHEQINLAVDRAIRAAVGPHRKVVARRLAHREAAYLSHLVTVVPPRGIAAPVTAPSPPSAGSPLRLAALGAWIVTVAAGAWLLAGWLARGGLRRRRARVAGVPRPVVAGHFTLALAGLGIWIGFLATGLPALAWAAVAVALAVAGLGMATLAGGLPEVRPAGDEPASAGTASAGTAPAGTPPARATAIQVPAGKPLARIALHGALAAVTILLVVLAAVAA